MPATDQTSARTVAVEHARYPDEQRGTALVRVSNGAPGVVPRYRLPPDDDDRGTTRQGGIGPSVRAMRKPDCPRWKFAAGAMTLVTAFAAVAACGSDADSVAPPAAGPHSTHSGGSS